MTIGATFAGSPLVGGADADFIPTLRPGPRCATFYVVRRVTALTKSHRTSAGWHRSNVAGVVYRYVAMATGIDAT